MSDHETPEPRQVEEAKPPVYVSGGRRLNFDRHEPYGNDLTDTATADDLAAWCETGASWFADQRWTRAEWLASFEAGTTDVDSLLVLRGPAPADA